MRVIGIDFTSAPSKRKTIVAASCRAERTRLTLDELLRWPSFAEFESFLDSKGIWLAGIDAPLGQPRQLIEDLAWPTDWAGYVELVGGMTKHEFVKKIRDYCAAQPSGKKHHLRATDRMASSCSPMMMYGVPVGKMFYEVAPRLLKSTVSVLPCRPTRSRRVVVETYPALMVRRAIGVDSYKNDQASKGTQLSQNRKRVIRFFQSLDSALGISLELSSQQQRELIAEPSADGLDATLCALQLAAARCRAPRVVPKHADPLEGWIVDPEMGRSERARIPPKD